MQDGVGLDGAMDTPGRYSEHTLKSIRQFLEGLTYRQLQDKAKKQGVKANLARWQIIEEILQMRSNFHDLGAPSEGETSEEEAEVHTFSKTVLYSTHKTIINFNKIESSF